MINRQARIREMLERRGEVAIGDLAATLGVSEMTIRRDLDRMERAGRVRRTHGGAVPAERLAFEFDFAARRQSHRAAKEAIAAAAVRLVKPGDRLILDAGTTTLDLACRLREIPGLVVVTPSLAVATELQFAERIQTILLGGELRRGSPDLTGVVPETVLDMLAADIAFQGADGIGLDGRLYTGDLRMARVDQKIRSRVDRTYILADSSKVGGVALACHGRLQDVDGWFTDDGIAPADLAALRSLGVDITVVDRERRTPETSPGGDRE
jgi:DeoR/GlpR family transcriptional regulator of sugar metabolism